MAVQEQPMTASPDRIIFRFHLSELDPSLLPVEPSLLQAGTSPAAESIRNYFEKSLGFDLAEIHVDFQGDHVNVEWKPRTPNSEKALIGWAVDILKAGAYKMGQVVFSVLAEAFPENIVVLCNYGMLLSDLGHLDKAIPILVKTTNLEPDHANAWNALGVAYQRKEQDEDSLFALQKSHSIDPENIYTIRNLGGLIAKKDPPKALNLLKKAAFLLPNDQGAQYGYGLCLRLTGNLAEASSVLHKAIDVAPYSELAELCRSELTAISHEIMREKGGGVRMDVVMYCIAAMERYKELGSEKTKTIAFEIAMLGRSGFDINNPSKKYKLKSLPGEFTGLQLVAYMYVGLKMVDPSLDSGIDFSREYEHALQLYKTR